ncbi:MAG: hypothetical protein JRI68_34470, partial [Deltaproteobacteria bacterium]|nr:hypothetical protein [Deltaproteobacteria bacterium]
GTVVGTPFYMSPEQAKGSKDIDSRSDIYSVGIMLYECITGQKPFHAGTFNELIFKIVLESPPPPEQFVPDLDPAFSRIVRKAMSRPADDRYQTAGEMRDALSVWLHTGQDELTATQVMEPPPAPGREAGPPPQVRPVPQAIEPDHANAATTLMEPESEAATRIIDRPPPPPLLPREARVTDRPQQPTGFPGAPGSGTHRWAAVVVMVTVVAVAAGGIAAVVVTSDDAPAGAEPAALGPPGSETGPNTADPSSSAADEPAEDHPGTEIGLDSTEEPPTEEPPTEEPPEEPAPAVAQTDPSPSPQPPKTESPSAASKPAGASTAGKSATGNPSGKTGGGAKGRGKPGRSIATEL